MVRHLQVLQVIMLAIQATDGPMDSSDSDFFGKINMGMLNMGESAESGVMSKKTRISLVLLSPLKILYSHITQVFEILYRHVTQVHEIFYTYVRQVYEIFHSLVIQVCLLCTNSSG